MSDGQKSQKAAQLILNNLKNTDEKLITNEWKKGEIASENILFKIGRFRHFFIIIYKIYFMTP